MVNMSSQLPLTLLRGGGMMCVTVSKLLREDPSGIKAVRYLEKRGLNYHQQAVVIRNAEAVAFPYRWR